MSAGGAGRGRARRLRAHGARSAAGRSGRVCPPCLTAATFWERSRREGRGTPPTRGTRVAEERLQRWTPRKARGMRAAAGVAACPGPGPHPEPVRSPRNRQCAHGQAVARTATRPTGHPASRRASARQLLRHKQPRSSGGRIAVREFNVGPPTALLRCCRRCCRRRRRRRVVPGPVADCFRGAVDAGWAGLTGIRRRRLPSAGHVSGRRRGPCPRSCRRLRWCWYLHCSKRGLFLQRQGRGRPRRTAC